MIGQKGIPAVYGGVERHVDELSKRLVHLGVEVLVYTRPYYSDPANGVHEGVMLKSLPSLPTKHLDAITHTLIATFHALRYNPDIYHFHAVGPSLLSFIPRIFRPHAKVVITFHCKDREHQKWGWLARKVLSIGEWTSTHFGHQTIAVSRELQNYIEQHYGREAIYIPNGGKLEEKIPASFIESAYGLTRDSYFLTVTRLVPHKGIHHLIRAFQALKTTKKLVIVGDASHTDAYVDQLKRMAAGYPNIIFTGWQRGKNLAEFYSNAYLYVQASEAEGLPISVLEAMSFGCPTLVSDIPSNAEVIGDTGRVFKNRSVPDLAHAMEQALLQPVQLREGGKQARKRLVQEYHWDRVAEKTVDLYDQLLEVSSVQARTAIR